MKTLVLALALLSAGCISQRTKENSILPAAVLAWPGVRGEIQYALERIIVTDATSASADIISSITLMNQGLEEKDFDKIRKVDWPLLASWAEAGIKLKIKRGVISIEVARSHRGRLLNFAHLVGILQGSITMLRSSKKQYWVRVPGVEANVLAGSDPLQHTFH